MLGSRCTYAVTHPPPTAYRHSGAYSHLLIFAKNNWTTSAFFRKFFRASDCCDKLCVGVLPWRLRCWFHPEHVSVVRRQFCSAGPPANTSINTISTPSQHLIFQHLSTPNQHITNNINTFPHLSPPLTTSHHLSPPCTSSVQHAADGSAARYL